MNQYSEVPYEGSDATGRPVMRKARLIGEWPTEMVKEACRTATERIAKVVGLEPGRQIPYGAPVYEAFQMTRPEAKKHAESTLLLTMGCDLSLVWCN